jgi:hypothetical protein
MLLVKCQTGSNWGIGVWGEVLPQYTQHSQVFAGNERGVTEDVFAKVMNSLGCPVYFE